MNYTRRPNFRLAALLALAFAPLLALPSSAQPPPRPDPPAGGDGQPRIQMPRRAAGPGPARDRAAVPEVGAGRIRGRITDDNGRPLRRVTVFTSNPQGFRQPRTALTDADGHYELTELPAGAYSVMASKGAFVRQSYGQRSRGDMGRPIELADGQTVDKIDFILSRGGVIAGRIVDELGEPMAEVQVQAMRFMPSNSGMRLGPAGRNAQTDDLGQYRLYGLAPGDYIVSVSARDGRMFGPEMAPTSADNTGYAPTYAPGTTSVADAMRIEVQPGQEVTADVQLVAARLHRIAGTVIDSQGNLVDGGLLRLVPKGEITFGGMGMGAPLRNGAFTLTQVPPGSYVLSVRTGGNGGLGRGRPEGPDVMEFAIVPVTVAGDDLLNVRVVTSRGLTAPGVVVAEGGRLPADQNLRVMVIATEPEIMGGARPAAVDANGRFQIDGIVGDGRLTVMGLGRGWMLKSVDYKGVNVTDKSIEFAADGGPLRVVVTNRVPVLSGTATSGNGAPLTDYDVLVFTTDTSAWERPGRQVRHVRADQQGGFRVEGLPPGDYYVAAFDGIGAEATVSPDVLARARSVAQQITLDEGQTRSVSLRLSPLPQ